MNMRHCCWGEVEPGPTFPSMCMCVCVWGFAGLLGGLSITAGWRGMWAGKWVTAAGSHCKRVCLRFDTHVCLFGVKERLWYTRVEQLMQALPGMKWAQLSFPPTDNHFQPLSCALITILHSEAAWELEWKLYCECCILNKPFIRSLCQNPLSHLDICCILLL